MKMFRHAGASGENKSVQEHQNDYFNNGCIPYGKTALAQNFEKVYLDNIRFYCLFMSDRYIESHFDAIKKFGSIIEDRGDDEDCTLEMVRRDNAKMWEQCNRYGAEYILIDEEHWVESVC